MPQTRALTDKLTTDVDAWLEAALSIMDEDDERAKHHFDRIRTAVRWSATRTQAYAALISRTPIFVYFSQYFSVRPRIHLANLAQRQASGDLDDDYDFGNLCLLDLLGFTAKELSDLASLPAPALPPNQHDQNAMAEYKRQLGLWQRQLDERQYKLNAASVALSQWCDECGTTTR